MQSNEAKSTSTNLVSVIIPTMDRPRMLERCITSVISNTYKNLEIIITDDSVTDESKLIASRIKSSFRKIIYIHNNEKSISAAINRAIKKSSGKYIFILDDDNVIDKGCIKELVNAIGANEKIGIVGPLAMYYSNKDTIMHAGTIRSRFMRRAIYPHQNEKWHNQIKIGEEVEDFANAFMFKREATERAGLWDLLVPYMGEDGDFEARVRKAGYRVAINPKAKTYHDIPYNPKEPYFLRISERRMYHSMHSKVLYVFRYDNMQQKITFALSIPIYLGFYIKAVIKDKNSKNNKLKLLKSLLKGTLDGFADAIKKRSKIEYL